MKSSTQNLNHPHPMKAKWLVEAETCFWLSLPLAAAQLTQSATGFVDTVMMGMLGSETIAAGGLGAALFVALMLVGTAIVSAVSPLVAEAFGAGRKEAVQGIVRQGFWLALTLSVPIMLLLWNMGALLRLSGQDPAIAILTQTYLRAVVWGITPALLLAVLRSFVSALSRTRPVMLIVLLGTGVNVIGNYILMFGKFGAPALGLAGIGYASAFSFWFMLVALGLYIFWQPELNSYQVFRRLRVLDTATLRQVLHIGIPMGVLTFVEAGLFAMTTVLVGQLGTVSLAAHQIALQSSAITFTVPLGISLGTTVHVGQRLGQGDRLGAQMAGYSGILLSTLFMLATGIVMWAVPTSIIALYLDIYDVSNTAVVMQAEGLLAVAAMFQIVDGVQVAATGALRGLQDTRVPMVVGVVAYWGIGLSSGYWLGFHMKLGSVGLWWGLAIGLAVASAVLTWRFSRISKQRPLSAIARS